MCFGPPFGVVLFLQEYTLNIVLTVANIRHLAYDDKKGGFMESVIKKRREILGYSQKELSELSGVNFRTLQDYEQGRKPICSAHADVVLNLSKALKCPIEYLIVDTPSERRLEYLINYANCFSKKEIVGTVNVEVDCLVPCLVNTDTGELVDTLVFRIEDKRFLKDYRKDNGWYVDWDKMPSSVKIYALVTKKDCEVQGLIGLKNDSPAKASYIHWACTAPHNNMQLTGQKRYEGVGGHLFAIAADKSFEWGYNGYVHGFAANKELLEHYIDAFEATFLGVLHIYQFMLNPRASEKLMEIYNYDWKNT